MEEIFKKKYLKYKQKYILLKGGAETFYLFISGIAEYVDGDDVWNNQLKKRILDKILPHFAQIEIRYYDPLFYGGIVDETEVQKYKQLIERPTAKATVNTYFKENMPNLTDLPNIERLNKNNHLILNLAGLDYKRLYNRFNILYLGYLPSDPPLFLHIPYLTILYEKVGSQSPETAIQIILFNDQLINHNYVSSNSNSYYFLYFYEQIKNTYKKYISSILVQDKEQKTRTLIFDTIDSLFKNANFLIKLYLLIYNITATINQSSLESKENNMDAVVKMLISQLDHILKNINFSILAANFRIPEIQVTFPPEQLPPPFDITELYTLYPDINKDILKLLCPYKMPSPTTTPDKYLSLLVSSVY